MASHETPQPTAGTEAATPARTKDVELSIAIDATPEAVWQAISTGEGLASWFPLDAEVVPGVGGTVSISWGPDVGGTGRIDVWEENRCLRYVEAGAEPAEPGAEPAEPGAELAAGLAEPAADDAADDAEAAAGPLVAVEFTIEGRGGATELRLVHSGFSADADWAEYFDTVESGWRYFLSHLKHYLERHAGTPRRMVWDRRKISLPKPEAWDRLFGAGGLVATDSFVPGGTGTLWSGHPVVVEMASPPIHLACRCEALNSALLLVELEPGGDAYSLGVWLSLYGVDESEAESLERSLRERLEHMV